MIRGLPFFCLAVLCAAPAWAASDNAIRVVNPDGSVTVFEMPQAKAKEPPPAPAPRKADNPPSPKTKPPRGDVAIAPPPAAKPKEILENKNPEPAPVARESMGRVIATEPAKATSKNKKVKAKKGKKEKAVEDVIAAPAEPSRPRGPLTADEALRIALDVAPPARGYEIFRRDYNGRPAYMVTFKTENGPHDVLIDSRTGDVLKR